MNKRIEKIKKKINGAKPKYYMDGDRICCVIIYGGHEYVGIADCSGYDRKLGKELAYLRAVDEIIPGKRHPVVMTTADDQMGKIVYIR